MKELSIEEKVKAYDEALKYAMIYYKNGNEDMKMMMKTCFPILTEESEDERIRKAIINFLHEGNQFKNIKKETRQRWIAWLEKQAGQKLPIENLPSEMKTIGESLGFTTQEECDRYNQMVTDLIMSDDDKCEQKSADKVEPKFKVGDWAVSNLDKKARQISEVHFDEYNSYYVVDGKSVNLEEYDRLHHLWTISDAKPGDVIYLPNGNNEYYFFIFKGIENAAVNSFAHFYQYNDGTSEVEGTIDRLFSVNDVFHPATKEQRDLLFQKMKEAGYEWDEDKKELKKIEQIPTDKIEPIFNVGDKIQYSKGCGTIMTIEKIENGEYIFSNNMGHTTIESGNKWYLVNSVEHKSAWSEEDKYNLSDIEAMIHTIKGDGLNADKLINWLKSLRPQSQWKPSDEQLTALLSEVNAWTKGCPKQIIFESLYNDLKKLNG